MNRAKLPSNLSSDLKSSLNEPTKKWPWTAMDIIVGNAGVKTTVKARKFFEIRQGNCVLLFESESLCLKLKLTNRMTI